MVAQSSSSSSRFASYGSPQDSTPGTWSSFVISRDPTSSRSRSSTSQVESGPGRRSGHPRVRLQLPRIRVRCSAARPEGGQSGHSLVDPGPLIRQDRDRVHARFDGPERIIAEACRSVDRFGEPGFHLWDLVCCLAAADGANFRSRSPPRSSASTTNDPHPDRSGDAYHLAGRSRRSRPRRPGFRSAATVGHSPSERHHPDRHARVHVLP